MSMQERLAENAAALQGLRCEYTERSVLCAILHYGMLMSYDPSFRILECLEESDFSSPVNANWFVAVKGFFLEHGHLDEIAFTVDLATRGELERLGGREAVERIFHEASQHGFAVQYLPACKRLSQLGERRRKYLALYAEVEKVLKGGGA